MAADLKIKTLPTEQASEKARWSPYIINGGTAIAVAGKDYCIVGGDTRMSKGYSISSRNVSKCFQLTNKCVLATAGMQAEAKTLRKVLHHKITMYNHKTQKDMTTQSISQMLSTTLYHKRFFPYYTFNVIGGIDEAGAGAVYGYDAVGSFERMPYGVTGSGSALITSILDNQVGFKNRKEEKKELSLEEALELVKNCFTCCAERDIYTGDSAEIYVITSKGAEMQTFPLKQD